MNRNCLISVFCVLAVAASAPGCSHSSGAAAPATAKATKPAVVVTIAPITLRPIQRMVTAVGTLQGFEEVTLAPKVEGRVRTLHHDVGDRVQPGEPLLELDATDYQLAVDEARRALELELSKLGLDEPPRDDFDVGALPNVVRAKHLLDNAAKRKGRVEALRGRNVATEQEWDQVLTDYNVADANWQQTLLEAKSTIAATRHRAAALAMAEQRLADTKIVAPPFPSQQSVGLPKPDYVVAERMVSEGEMVRAPSTTVFRLVMDHPLKLSGPIPERYMGEVKLRQPVKLQVEAYPTNVFDGRVTRVNPTVDAASRTFTIEAIVDNTEHRLKAGSFAKLGILTRVDEQARTVPLEALVTFAGVNKVFEIRDGKAHAVEVRPGIHGAGWVEVVGDFQNEHQIITSGHSQLANGTPVRIREPAAAVARRN